MKIGIIGSGHIGGTLGKHLAQAGHEVMFSSRHPETLGQLLRSTNGRARAGSVQDASQFAEVIVFAPPFWETDAALARTGPLDGKVIIDTTNFYKSDLSGPALPEGMTAAQELAKKIPHAHVIKAFNHLRADVLAHESRPAGEGQLVAFVCGDDDAAKEIVEKLVEDCGFLPMDAGGLDDVWHQELRGELYDRPMRETEAREALEQVGRSHLRSA